MNWHEGCLDPPRIDPRRGLERCGDDWTLFGISLDPDALLGPEDPPRADFSRPWLGPAERSRADLAILHGRLVGARVEARALSRSGATVQGVVWAVVGDVTGHYAAALALEGAQAVYLVDAPLQTIGKATLSLLNTLHVHWILPDEYEALCEIAAVWDVWGRTGRTAAAVPSAARESLRQEKRPASPAPKQEPGNPIETRGCTVSRLGASVNFRHFQYQIDEDVLRRYGSSHRELLARRELADMATLKAVRFPSKAHEFSLEQLLCANEAFPEAAVSDPFADLETLNEWKTGYRAFPYPGIYSRIGLLGQSPKGAATSSVGVVGEILTGLYAQAGIAPWVHARVTADWPDFILLAPGPKPRFHFVESKARSLFDEEDDEHEGRIEYTSDTEWSGMPKSILGEGVQKAVRDLLADPRVTVWYSFIAIRKLAPLKADVTFLEMTADVSLARPEDATLVPGSVLDAFARRGVAEASVSLTSDDLSILNGKRDSAKRKKLRRELAKNAADKASDLITRMGLQLGSHENALLASARNAVRAIPLGEFRSGATFERSREMAAKGAFAPVRGGPLMIRDLRQEEREKIEEGWKAYEWDAATLPFSYVDNASAWRCSEAVLMHNTRGTAPASGTRDE